MAKRKIAVVTCARSDYCLMYWVIKGIHDDPDLELQLIVTGMHLSPEFGLTYEDIVKDGFPIAEKVEIIMSSDTEVGIGCSIGLGVIGLSQTLPRLKPDMVVLLGDRFEILAAAIAAMVHKIPVAHIHGGESTEGLIDEPIRHSVTKMSYIHFPSTDFYAKRIMQMGEEDWRVFPFGAPGLDNIYKLDLLSRDELAKELNLSLNGKLIVVTFHPVTLEKEDPRKQFNELLLALEKTDAEIIFTFPNADTHGRGLIELINNFCRTHSKAGGHCNLGQLRYISLLKLADIMVGNSSSGIIEAPSLKLPVVNIGDRQRGRIRGRNVIDVECKSESIYQGIIKGLSEDFIASLQDMVNPYGQGNSSARIVDKLKDVEISQHLIKKRFADQ